MSSSISSVINNLCNSEKSWYLKKMGVEVTKEVIDKIKSLEIQNVNKDLIMLSDINERTLKYLYEMGFNFEFYLKQIAQENHFNPLNEMLTKIEEDVDPYVNPAKNLSDEKEVKQDDQTWSHYNDVNTLYYLNEKAKDFSDLDFFSKARSDLTFSKWTLGPVGRLKSVAYRSLSKLCFPISRNLSSFIETKRAISILHSAFIHLKKEDIKNLIEYATNIGETSNVVDLIAAKKFLSEVNLGSEFIPYVNKYASKNKLGPIGRIKSGTYWLLGRVSPSERLAGFINRKRFFSIVQSALAHCSEVEIQIGEKIVNNVNAERLNNKEGKKEV